MDTVCADRVPQGTQVNVSSYEGCLGVFVVFDGALLEGGGRGMECCRAVGVEENALVNARGAVVVVLCCAGVVA